MISTSQKRFLVAAVALFLIATLVVPAINVGRYRAAVSRALSAAMGREVTVRDVSMHLLPTPGLTLSGLVVADDPQFGAEPMLRSDEVTADLRLSSLWRGRFEISQLSLTDPSLNLVRLPDGRWNIESLFERARETPAAPTTKRRPEYRARFPYIESSGGRINLKRGLEKTVYALTDADFALWLASEDEWRMRLEARPMRTDANLSDTGLIRIEGSARRGPSLGETPLSLKFIWSRGQLGQITHLLRGTDAGWRGAVQINATLAGTPQDLHIAADTAIDDFKRYDIFSGDSLTLYVNCKGNYSDVEHKLSELNCASPVGNGQILARGDVEFSQPRSYDLAFSLDKVPAQFVANVVHRAKQGMPSDINATGTLDAEFALKTRDGHRLWSGMGTTSDWTLQSKQLGTTPLALKAVHFAIEPGTPTKGKNKPSSAQRTTVILQTFDLDLDGDGPATVKGSISSAGYHFDLQGPADLKRAAQVSSFLGLYAPAVLVEGNAKLSGQVNGSWAHFQAPAISGEAQIRNVTATINGFATPVHIASGELVADSNNVTLQNASLSFPKVHVSATGSVQFPHGCQPSPDCSLSFDLKSDSLTLDDVNRLLNPKTWDRPWYERIVGSSSDSNPPWTWVYANGHIAVQKFALKSVNASKVTAQVALSPGTAEIQSLRANVLGGTFQGTVAITRKNDQPFYASKGKFDHISMDEIASAMKDGWATGKVSLNYEGTSSGWNAADLATAVTATGDFDWRNGSLPHIGLADDPQPLAVQHFAGSLAVTKGTLNITDGKLQNRSGIYEISGTASFGRQLKLTLTRESGAVYTVGGTLAHPAVTTVEKQAKQASLRGRSR